MNTTTRSRRQIVRDMKRQNHVAYFVDATRFWGRIVGMTPEGALVCKDCYYDGKLDETHFAESNSLTLSEACGLAVQEQQDPLCDFCGKDVRS